MNAKEELEKYYQSFDEEGRLCSRYGMVEYFTTMQYIKRFLKPGIQVLEIGAGTGRYSHALAWKGYSVDAVELIKHNIDVFQSKTTKGEPVTIQQGDATDLSDFPDNRYDLTLLLGPMYHLFTAEDKQKALREAVRVTKHGGILFAAYCMSDPALLSMGFIKGKIQSLLTEGLVDPTTFETFSRPEDLFTLYRKEEIDQLREQLDVTQLFFLATDGPSHFIRDVIDQMDDETYRLYLQYHLATCERADMAGCSHHTLDIFRKN